jgi:hypothetical protein
MNPTIRNFVLGAAFAAAAGSASAATFDVRETPAGDEKVGTIAADGAYHVIYTLNLCTLGLAKDDILVVTAQSQVQNSSVDHGIYFAPRIIRDTSATSTTGLPVDNQGNGMNIAAHDYRLVSPKVTISKVADGTTDKCFINYIGRADDDGEGGSLDVVNNRGRLQVLKITP